MKKERLLIFITICFVLCLISCEKNKKVTIYETLNKLVNIDYQEVDLIVKTSTNDDTLIGTYKIKNMKDYCFVEYSNEVLNKFSINDEIVTPPVEEKSVTQGSMKVKDGTIIEQNGEKANISLEQININGLEFNESYFSNIQSNEGKFVASVNNTKDFLGFNLICSDLKITINYSNEKIDSLIITYKSESLSQVEITYMMR